MMLRINNLSSGYDDVQVLYDVSFEVNAGEIVCLLGRNGAGKTTCMKTIMGLIRARTGTVECNGEIVSALPAHEVPRQGIGYIPQGRRLFAELTVAENLEIGLMVRQQGDDMREQVLSMFPRLRERLDQRADTLSGGEQQMLATGRALCINPSVLLLDEPTEGLQPSMIEQIRQAVTALRKRGVAILLVEQRVDAVLSIADRVVFLENGRNHPAITTAELEAKPELLTRFVGV
jgi:branched-chain amino acid transport system ATP-binding protein